MLRLPMVKTGQIALFTCSIIFAIIPTVAVVLRIIARRIANRRLDAADYLIFCAWILTIGLAICCALETVYGGFGWHRVDVVAEYGQQVITNYHIITLPLEIFWTLSISFSKLSLLTLYIKVFPLSRLTTVSKITWVGVALLAVSGALCTLLICQPIQYNWDLTLPGGHCGSQKSLFGIYGVLNLFTDLMVLGLPIPSLVGLKLPTLRKVGLVATFAIGFVTCIASVIRLVFLTSMDYLDITYSGIPFMLMTVVEPSLAVTLACVPLLRPILGKGDSRYSATGTRNYGASLSFRGLNTRDSENKSAQRASRMTRGRSSCPSVPAEMLQYQYEMGLSKEGVPVDIQELMPTTNGYHYQAQVSTGHESDGSSRGKSDEMEISPVSNIMIKQEWSVSNQVKQEV
ncbi:hypothetical protein N0V93_006763 [Gnomoniopsis smithogilvyi]|uniref:Rhodopsin domain-containing protein n=1 Tax=Gnomoniopsis smithogilvyi TaxID=1191159 RepID=A0A9W8YQB6_9PEZI|nr:hypothetical protein N0V93_006763 [Gnomoniopsis smithogilvyi]